MTLSQALSELAPDERAVVVLSAVQGYTTREIGEILDLPHGTVSSKLYRTLIKLRKNWSSNKGGDQNADRRFS